MKRDINKESYESKAGVATYESEQIKWTEKYVTDKYFKVPGLILDLGCGTGRTSVFLSRLGLKVEAVDYSEAMISKAKNKYGNAATSANFRVMDAKSLDYPDDFFDYALFSFNGVDYLYPESDRTAAFKEIHRVMKTGGVFAFSSHNALFIPNNLPRLWTVLRSFAMGRVWPYRMEFHLFGRLLTHYSSIRGQVKEMRDNGFDFLELVSKYGKDIKTVSLKDPYPTYVCRKTAG